MTNQRNSPTTIKQHQQPKQHANNSIIKTIKKIPKTKNTYLPTFTEYHFFQTLYPITLNQTPFQLIPLIETLIYFSNNLKS